MANVQTIEVKGMTCGHCVAAVREEISKLEGVEAVSVDLDSGRVEVNSGTPLQRSELVAAVDEAGYEVAPS